LSPSGYVGFRASTQPTPIKLLPALRLQGETQQKVSKSGKENSMKFSLLLFVLSQILKIASFTNAKFKRYISKAGAKVLIKTADGQYGRLFIFDKGKFSSLAGDQTNFDVALVWRDAGTGFSAMTSKDPAASFNAAAEGKLRIEGMGVYAQWFEGAIKLVM
jgi:hypothetical protein